MGSLESGQSIICSSSAPSRIERHPYGPKARSRFASLVLSKKIDYLQWVYTVAIFFSFVVLFQMILPGSVMEKSGNYWGGRRREVGSGDFMLLKEIGGFDFGEDIKFEPSKLLAKFQKKYEEANVSSVSRFGYRKPQLALVFADLLFDPQQILMVTIAIALREIGYKMEVYSLEDGPVHAVWKNVGVPVTIIKINEKEDVAIDWLNYDGIIVNSIEAREVVSCLLQEPFKSVPLIWTIHEKTLATNLRKYTLNSQFELVSYWKKLINRATVVVFPNHALPMLYSACDVGNYFVIPGSPAEAWEADNFMVSHKDSPCEKMDYGPDDFLIVIVGNQFLYRGLWLEHAFILKALLPIFMDFPSDENSNSQLKIIVLSGDSTSNYSVAVEAIARKLRYPRSIVRHVATDEQVDCVLSMSDLVIYGSFLEEQSFPGILIKGMRFGKPIIAPDLSMIRKHVKDKVNGYLFPKDNIMVVTQILSQVVLNGKLSPFAHNIASNGKLTAKNLMASETVEGYASLVENVLKLSSEVAPPKASTEIPSKLKEEWKWQLFESISNSTFLDRTLRSRKFLEKAAKQWDITQTESSDAVTSTDGTFIYTIWEEEYIEIANMRKLREEQELKDRSNQPHGTWDDVYRSVKKADRSKDNLHERDDGELERTGQPVCIYEPYLGEGTWPFLHHTSLYRGIGLSMKDQRPGTDDIDAPSHLPLLNDLYYRDLLGEHGAFFAIANCVDHIHKNAWIGFQSWRATARKDSLSKASETALLDAIQARQHGDALYFWSRMDKDPRNLLLQDFWTFCDAINAGNCKFVFSKVLKQMYGIKQDSNFLPPMPMDGGTWSVMHSWVLPTKSFLEFVMFSRMFVDSLDAQFYDEHHQSGHCHLSLLKDKHCYTRVLELLVNVWAYHSPRRMVYVNPVTGEMQEQHKLKKRRGKMRLKWFSNTTLKSMDEDLAEEYDSDHPRRRWLWPSTGEVFWPGMHLKERNLRNQDRENRKKHSKEKLSRMVRRHRQKPVARSP